MSKINKMIITEVGQQALWNSKNTGIDFDITHVEFGAGNGNYGNEYKVTKLSEPMQFKAILNGEKIQENQVRIFVEFQGYTTYLVCEIGLWNGEPNKEGSVLFAYCASEKDKAFLRITEGLGVVFNYDFVFTDEDIGNVKVVADDDQSTVMALIARHEADLNAHPYYVNKGTDNTFKESNTFEKPIIGDLYGTATNAETAETAKHAIIADDAMKAYKADKATTADHATESDHALNADNAVNADKATTATNADNAVNADHALNADHATESDHALNADNAVNADKAITATNADNAVNADHALNADHLKESVKIHGVPFDGSKDIDLPEFSTDKSGLVPQPIGSLENKVLYADGTWREIDLTSVGGAETAEKLAVARTIGLSGAVTGTATEFDGSKNITIDTTAVEGVMVVGTVANAREATHALNADHATESDHALNADNAVEAQHSLEADHALNADKATTAITATNADNAVNADHAVNADKATTATNADNAVNADHAVNADKATTATNADNAVNADHAVNADKATTATNADNAVNADHAVNADKATTATNADNAVNADHLKESVKIHGVPFDGSKDIDLPEFSTDKSGLVPQPIGSLENKVLYADGTWREVESSTALKGVLLLHFTLEI